jgi:hypothetical protein
MSQERDARRRKLLASYHIISKKIFPDDTARLAWLEEQVGARSSRQLNNRELFWCICVLDGKPPPFKIKKRSGAYIGAGQNGLLTPAQARKIGALERDLGWNETPARLWAFIERQTGNKSGPEMLTQQNATKVITGLVALRNDQIKKKMRSLID